MIFFLSAPFSDLFLHSSFGPQSQLISHFSESGDLLIIAEWSRELDELRAAFARSLDYLKQDVEESKYLVCFYEV